MPNFTPLSPGARLNNGRYRIRTLLTTGGFGAVYLAEDLVLGGRLCVIKESFDRTQEGLEQYEIEAATLSTLTHPHLVRVTDKFIEAGQKAFLVMEYIEGEDLDDLLKRSPRGLPEDQVLEWLDQILDAVAYCHNFQPKVIHRDIKPSNIRIRRSDGKAILVDFGIAKIGGISAKTHKAARGYTPGYSPLEQYGTGTDTYSDVYALGATLYHLLTGQAPPEAVDISHSGATLQPPRFYNTAISPETEQVILTAMQMQPQRRYQTAQEMREALRNRQRTIACPNCGAPVRLGARFCQKCGKSTTLARPIIFPKSHYQAHTVDDLIRGCDGLWDEAKVLFWQGEFDRWLTQINEPQLAQTARTIRSRHRDSSAALEEFLQVTAPQRSRPVLVVRPDSLDAGRLHPGDHQVMEFVVSNEGRGYLHGEVTSDSPDWLLVRTAEFGCLPGVEQSLKIEIRTDKTPGEAYGIAYTGKLLVQSNQGNRVITVRLVVVDPPAAEVSPRQIDFGEISYGIMAERSISVRNRGGGLLQATIQSESWLPCLAPDGRAMAAGSGTLSLALQRGQQAQLDLRLDSSLLPKPGQHRGQVRIDAPQARTPTVSVEVTVRVKPPFLLNIGKTDSAIRTSQELWTWCDRHWLEALDLLRHGRLTACLSFIGEDVLAPTAERSRLLRDLNIGLETLLRACGAPAPEDWKTNAIEIEGDLGFGFLPKLAGKPNELTFLIHNKSSRGYLHGRLRPIANWLEIPHPDFGCRPGEIAAVTIHAHHQARRRKLFSTGEDLVELIIE